MMTGKMPVRPHREVVYTSLDDSQAALLHLGTKRYYSLNETGMRIWGLLEEAAGTQDIAAALESEFDVGTEEASLCVAEFLEELSREGLVEGGSSTAEG